MGTIGQLESFTGLASSVTAEAWITKAEYRFAVAEAMLGAAGTTQATGARLLTAASALKNDAELWFVALPARPVTWEAFRAAFLRRFVSAATTDAKLNQLRCLVAVAQRVREKLTMENLRRYATQFLQLAGEVPSNIMTDYMKRQLFADGLPRKHAEYVLSRNRGDNPPELHVLVDDVLARALDRALSSAAVGGSASASAAAAGGDAMQLDALSLCVTQLGMSREEAARHLESVEGWAPHDTNGRAAPAPSPASGASSDDQMERLLNAFAARFGGANSSSGSQGKAQSQRRNAPDHVRGDIPDGLFRERKAAGLCAKCGVAKYEGGHNGHNSRTCKAVADKTTSVAEGKKKAGF